MQRQIIFIPQPINAVHEQSAVINSALDRRKYESSGGHNTTSTVHDFHSIDMTYDFTFANHVTEYVDFYNLPGHDL